MRKRRSASEWRALIIQQGHRGVDDHEYAEELGVSVVTLRWWRWRLKESNPEAQPCGENVFVRLRAVDDIESPSSLDRFDVRLPGGCHVSVPAGFDELELTRLIRILETAC